MGLDAVIFADVPAPVTTSMLLGAHQLAVRSLGDMWKERADGFGPRFEMAAARECDPQIPLGFVRVYARTRRRYYGPLYERGHLWSNLAICDFLRHAFPGSTVYYGSDSEAHPDVSPMTNERRESLLAHLFSDKGDAYHEEIRKSNARHARGEF